MVNGTGRRAGVGRLAGPAPRQGYSKLEANRESRSQAARCPSPDVRLRVRRESRAPRAPTQVAHGFAEIQRRGSRKQRIAGDRERPLEGARWQGWRSAVGK